VYKSLYIYVTGVMKAMCFGAICRVRGLLTGCYTTLYTFPTFSLIMFYKNNPTILFKTQNVHNSSKPLKNAYI